MRNRLTAIVLVFALAAALVQLPVAAAQPVTRHSCCHKQISDEVAPEATSLLSLPAAPVHRCCIAKAPLKVPALPIKSNDLSDQQVSSTMIVSPDLHTSVLVFQAPGDAIRSAINLSVVLRV